MPNKQIRDMQILIALDMLNDRKSSRRICDRLLISPNTLQTIKKHRKYFQMTPSIKKEIRHYVEDNKSVDDMPFYQSLERTESILGNSLGDRIKKAIIHEQKFQFLLLTSKFRRNSVKKLVKSFDE
jgi:hypothetical protein